MVKFLSILLFIIFLAICIVHFYWAFGGSWGIAYSIPTDVEGKKMLHPKFIGTILIGIFLLSFGLFFLVQSNIVSIHLPTLIKKYGGWIISLIFILRAIGEFHYIGFFKKFTDSDFAIMDTRYFSPLCLLIGIIGIYLSVKNRKFIL